VLELIQSSKVVNEARDIPVTGRGATTPVALTGELEQRNRQLAALIARLAEQDQDALTALYDLTSRQLYGLLLRIVGNAATAEEVLFDVYTQAWRQAARYDRQRGTPLAWLITMARSRALDRLRAGGYDESHAAPLEQAYGHARAADAEQDAIAAEMRRTVRAALDTLPPEQRAVIELAYYGGLSHSEIAGRLGQPLGTVKTRARRAMIKLRDVLNPVIEGVL
jgi:RNA polymerase sigma-70 factor (ECF subfamily)